MIDTHCHIQTEQFDADREEIISNAEAGGVSHFIVPAIDLESFDATLKIASEYPNIYCGLGIHPHSAMQWNDEVRKRISDEVDSNSNVVAIGEIGLDYFYDFCPKDQQIKAFRAQIELALEKGKPIIIHTRDSIDETLDIVDEYYKGKPFVTGFGQFHCFSGNSDQMKRAVSLGFCVSYTGNITFKNTTLTDVVRQTPEDSILIETDSPYLAPVPYRGKRNSPEYLGLIAQKIAEIKQKDIQEIMTLTTQNAKRLFLGALAVMIILLTCTFSAQEAYAQPGSKPPDSVLTKDRREAEEIIKKQRDELMRAQEERRRDSIKSAQHDQDELMKEAMDQARKDSIRAVEKIADEARMLEKAKTPIAWKAIGIGAGGGVGNLSGVSQSRNGVALAPTSVFASSFFIGTAITRGIDFEFSYNSFSFGDDLTNDHLFRAGEHSPPRGLDTNNRPAHYFVPTHEDMSTKYLSFDFRFVINPRSPVKFYLGLGYIHVTIKNSQTFYPMDSSNGSLLRGADGVLEHAVSRGGIKGLIGARYDMELGDKFILSPFIQMGAGFLFAGEEQVGGFDFYTTGDPIVFTHLNIGASLYFGWFGVQRYK